MKKILALLLVLVMCLALTACSSGSTPAATEAPAATEEAATEAPAEEAAATEEAATEEAATEAPAEEAAATEEVAVEETAAEAPAEEATEEPAAEEAANEETAAEAPAEEATEEPAAEEAATEEAAAEAPAEEATEEPAAEEAATEEAAAEAPAEEATEEPAAEEAATEEAAAEAPAEEATEEPATEEAAAETVDMSGVKLGVITLHDELSTYDKNFLEGVEEARVALGMSEDQVIIKTNIDESNNCYEAACELVDEGCNVIFADSFGHETFLLQAAQEYPDVQFCHATGTLAHTAGAANFHDAFASIYEGRYLAGVAAGMKLNEIKEAGNLKGEVPTIGYVGAFTYAEVISGYTSFYLGAKSVCPDVVMKVQFTGSWYDEMEEKSAAQALIDAGCDLISQHADSMGAPTACENAGIPNVSYNGSTVESCPNTFIVACRINWAPYFEYICTQVAKGEAIDTDWVGTIASGSVVLTDVNEQAAAAGTADKLAEVKAQLESGELHVFDTATEGFITVEGQPLTTYMADVDTDADYTPDTEAVADGYFHESEYRSAPYFNVAIDGIEMLNNAY